jgi:hypothetical protein
VAAAIKELVLNSEDVKGQKMASPRACLALMRLYLMSCEALRMFLIKRLGDWLEEKEVLDFIRKTDQKTQEVLINKQKKIK